MPKLRPGFKDDSEPFSERLARLRGALGLEEGDEMIVAHEGERIVMRKLHMGDILEDAEEARKSGKTISHKVSKSRYGI